MGAVLAALSVEARRRLSRPSCLSHCGRGAARYHRSGRRSNGLTLQCYYLLLLWLFCLPTAFHKSFCLITLQSPFSKRSCTGVHFSWSLECPGKQFWGVCTNSGRNHFVNTVFRSIKYSLMCDGFCWKYFFSLLMMEIPVPSNIKHMPSLLQKME